MSKSSQRISAATALTLLVASLCFSASGLPKTLELGAGAPDFNLPGVDGKNYKLADFDKAEVLVIVFTCNHCPTAQAYEERIKRLASDYKNKGVALVAISSNDPKAVRLDELGYSDMSDSLEDMKIRAKRMGFSFPYLYDGETQKVSRAYGPVTTPHVFVFDKARNLQFVGRIDDSEKPERVKVRDTRNAIEALLAGNEVPVKKTRTIGCSIKWSEKREYVKEAFEKWAAEDVTLEMIDANGIKELVANDSGKLRLVNIWATWCGACVVEFDDLVEINRMYRGREFEMITISGDSPEKKDKALSFLKKKQASCKNYLFEPDDLYLLMESVDKESLGGMPYTLLIEPRGKIIYRQLGMIDPLGLKTAIVEDLGRYYK
ncbi:MAG TPA: redoxin domain-containing protein [Sedimentisphaerales bacterium]|nr:redoxin domain-containing protein [Sedimentisphaerales bacterium]